MTVWVHGIDGRGVPVPVCGSDFAPHDVMIAYFFASDKEEIRHLPEIVAQNLHLIATQIVAWS